MNRLLTQDQSLIGENFGQLRNLMTREAENIMAGGVLNRLSDLLKDVTKNGPVKLENLRSKDMKSVRDKSFQFFMADVKSGKYDLYLRKDFITNPDPDINMKSFRKSSRDAILDQVSQTVKGVNYDDLQKTGSRLDLLEVTATADFIAAGGMLEKSLYGSFGVKASDMITIEGQWAFSDPEFSTIYFIPEFTDSVSKDGISWTMAYIKGNKILNRVAIGDYVDPALRFEHKEMQEYMESRAYRVKEEKQESTPLAARARNYGTVNYDFTQSDREKMAELDSDLREAENSVVKARNTLLFQGVR